MTPNNIQAAIMIIVFSENNLTDRAEQIKYRVRRRC